MKNISVLLTILVLSSCSMVDEWGIELPEYDNGYQQTTSVYPFTKIADERFTGVFTTTDNLGFVTMKFNGTHYATYIRFWTSATPYKEVYERHLTLESDGTLTAEGIYEGFGYTHYEFLYNHATYSWNSDGTVLTINGKVYTKE